MNILKQKIIFVLILCSSFMPVAIIAQNELTSQIYRYINPMKAEVGVAIIVNSKDTIIANNNIHYPLLSVFKAHQALMVMEFLRNNKISLDTVIQLKKQDLNPNTYSPIYQKFPDGTIMPIKQLIKYSLQESDNNACDKLFDISGGIDDMDVYVNKIGLKNTVLKFNENQMQQDISRVYDNWSTVLDAAKLFEIVFFSNKLPNDEYTDFLREALKECKTGKYRIPQKLNDESIIIAHKTGSGPKNKYGKFIATNDVGTIWLDNGKHYTIAIFVKDSAETPQINASIIADISRMVYDYLK